MSLDLVAVQRDAALLDALSQRQRSEDIESFADPVVGLLAALAADVDNGLPGADPAPVIPEQNRRQPHPAAILTLAVPAVPLSPRHAARAVAALAVAAIVLSIGGVAAAVTGDPLTPYKNVINVVRGSYHDVMPNRSLIAPEPIARTVTPKAKFAAKAARNAKTARQEVGARSSRNAWRAGTGRSPWYRDAVHRRVSDRQRWNPHRSFHRFADRRFAERRAFNRHHRRWGGSGQRPGWGAGAGPGAGGTGWDSSDAGGQGDGAGDDRR